MVINIYRNSSQPVLSAYDHVITNLYMDHMQHGHKTYAVCGCSPGTGATAVSVELAASFAEAGRKTLLIDMDLRKEKAHQHLNEKIGARGLSNYVAGIVPEEEIIFETNIKQLHYIGGGTAGGDHTVKILCSHKLKELLERLYDAYDFIVIDTPSLSATLDSKVLCSLADSVVLVAAMEESKKKQLEDAKVQLDRLGIPISGVVATKASWDIYRQYINRFDYFEKKEYLQRETGKRGWNRIWKRWKQLLKKIVGLSCLLLLCLIPSVTAHAEPEQPDQTVQTAQTTNPRCPIVMIPEYDVNGEVSPGSEFELTVQVKNMDPVLAASQMRTTLTIKTEGIYLAEGDVNQRYTEWLEAGETETHVFRLTVSRNVKEELLSNLILECSFNYVSQTGTIGSNSTAFSIDIAKRSELKLLEVTIPDHVYAYIPTLMDLKYENTGEKQIKEVSMTVSGNVTTADQEITLEPASIGRQMNDEQYITFTQGGEQELQIHLSYEDEDGNVYELPVFELQTDVSYDLEVGETGKEETGIRSAKIFSSAVALAIGIALIGILRVGVSCSRKRMENGGDKHGIEPNNKH